jgi:PadR family transcriptional regulator, regulatory protein PadR
MAEDLKLSPAGLKLVRHFCDDSSRRWSGTELSKKAGIGSGTLYPLLAKLEAAGWLTAEWEQIDPKEQGRPRRRYYHLTAIGARGARKALADYQLPHAIGEPQWVT